MHKVRRFERNSERAQCGNRRMAKFGRRIEEISIALGRDPESLDLRKRHPFDLALVRIPKGKTLCPYHSHSRESGFTWWCQGQGSIRDKEWIDNCDRGRRLLLRPRRSAISSANAGEEDFVYYVIADNPRGDSCYYPDSGKFAVMKEGN